MPSTPHPNTGFPRAYDNHMHTPLCKHAVGDPVEYAEIAYQQGLDGIIVTCHNPLPNGWSKDVRMTPEEWPRYLETVAQARDIWSDRLDVRLGLECDYLPGFGIDDWLKRQADSAPFDYLLVSIHPQIGIYRERFWQGDPVAYQKTYFTHLAEAAEFGVHDCLAHPDLVKNVTASDWEVERVLPHINDCLDRIAAAGMAMEFNTSGWNKTIEEGNPGPLILQEMAKRQIPVVLGSDSHIPERVADRFDGALDWLKQAGYQDVSYFLQRQRHIIPIDDLSHRMNTLTEKRINPLGFIRQ